MACRVLAFGVVIARLSKPLLPTNAQGLVTAKKTYRLVVAGCAIRGWLGGNGMLKDDGVDGDVVEGGLRTT